MLLSTLSAIFSLLATPGCNGNVAFAGGALPLVVVLCAPTLFVVLRYFRSAAQAAAPEALRLAELPFRRFPELP